MKQAASIAPPPVDAGRRYYLAFGCGRPGGNFRDLRGVPGDLARMRAVFEARGHRVIPLPDEPSAAEVRGALAAWLDAAALGPDDAVTLYVTGHATLVDGEHYLCLRGFDPDRAVTTGLKTQELVELVTQRRARPGQLGLIVDCCGAGEVLSFGVYKALRAAGIQACILASSDTWSPSFDGHFSRAFQAVARDLAANGNTEPALDQLGAVIRGRRRGPQISFIKLG